ncbi:MAG: hypothetical protein JXB19_12485 [Bacteroidales bacterium]|nr:hypothetical protein [Bacteroidales bacterium]
MINRVFITGLVFLTMQICSRAQEAGTFVVKPGESIADVLTNEEIYKYPEFIQGKVLFTSGTYIEAMLNYNKVLGEMQFINNKSDTLVIANNNEINLISLSEDTFFYDDGYLELVAGSDNIQLLVRNYVRLRDVKKQGAYGTTSSTGSADNYTSISSGDNAGTYQLKSSQEMVYSFVVEYYFRSGNMECLEARKNKLLKRYPEHKKEIKEFIKEESVNFNRRDDLVRLTLYLQNVIN